MTGADCLGPICMIDVRLVFQSAIGKRGVQAGMGSRSLGNGRTQTSRRQPCSESQTPRPPSPMVAGYRAMSASRRLWPCHCAGSAVAAGGAWIQCRARHGGRCYGGCRPRKGLVLVWTAQSFSNPSLHLWAIFLRALVPRLVTSGKMSDAPRAGRC